MKAFICRLALLLSIGLFAASTVSAQTISPYYEPLAYSTLLVNAPTQGTAATANDCSNSPAKFKGQNVIYVSPNGTDYASSTVPYVPGKPLQSGTGANAVVKPGQLVCFEAGTYQPFTINKSGYATSASDTSAIIRFEVVPNNTATIDLTCGNQPAYCAANTPYDGGITIVPPGGSTRVAYVLVSGFYVHGPDDVLSGNYSNFSAALNQSSIPYYNAPCIQVLGNQFGGNFVLHSEADHIYIVANTLEGCTGAGIATLFSDYVTIDGNTIYDTGWFNSYAESAISMLDDVDTYPNDPAYPTKYPHTYKNYIVNNTIFNNIEYEPVAPGAGSNPGKITDGEGIIIDTNLNSAAGFGFGPPGTPVCTDPTYTAPNCIAPYSGFTLVSNNQLWGNGSSAIETTASENVDITFNTMFNNDVNYNSDPNRNEAGRGEISIYDSLDINVSSNLIYTSGYDSQVQQTYDSFDQGLPYFSVLFPYIGTLVYENNTGYSCEDGELVYPPDELAPGKRLS